MAAWDCGSSLSIAYGADRAHRVASEEEIKVSLNWLGKKQQTAGQMFNLRGQRVDASYKGIVVKNGKKQIIK